MFRAAAIMIAWLAESELSKSLQPCFVYNHCYASDLARVGSLNTPTLFAHTKSKSMLFPPLVCDTHILLTLAVL